MSLFIIEKKKNKLKILIDRNLKKKLGDNGEKFFKSSLDLIEEDKFMC